ncbi:DUF4864 domain-containing protein [Roseibium sp.]|uniref:DUF4864 domain-containing protein n=1 Tax=Roseibium sp. TaxID=1936156 RepID=UPI003A96DD52
MRNVFFVCLWVTIGGILVGSPLSASATSPSSAFQSIIKNQMQAFRSGNADQAFSFASGDLKRRFQTPSVFMEMVKQGYQPVYRPKSVTFGSLRDTKSGPVQEVYVVGPKGNTWLALYSFEQQADGTWLISGCYLTKSPGLTA